MMTETGEKDVTEVDQPAIFDALDETIRIWDFYRFAVGDLLREIRDEHLYRQVGYSTFGEFLNGDVGITSEEAYSEFFVD